MNDMTMEGNEILAKDREHLSNILDEGFEDGTEALVFSVNRRYKLDRSVTTAVDGIVTLRTMSGKGAWVQKTSSVETAPAPATEVQHVATPSPAPMQAPPPQVPMPATMHVPMQAPHAAPAPMGSPLVPPGSNGNGHHAPPSAFHPPMPGAPYAPVHGQQPGAHPGYNPYNPNPYAPPPGGYGAPPMQPPMQPQYGQQPYGQQPYAPAPPMPPQYAQPQYAPYPPQQPPQPQPQPAPMPMPMQKAPPPIEDFRLETSPTDLFTSPNEVWVRLDEQGKELAWMALGLALTLPRGDLFKQHAIMSLGALVRAQAEPAFKALLVEQLTQAHAQAQAHAQGAPKS